MPTVCMDKAAKALQKNVDESAQVDERMTELPQDLLNPKAEPATAKRMSDNRL